MSRTERIGGSVAEQVASALAGLGGADHLGRDGLPVMDPISPRSRSSLHYVTTRIDVRGRLADTSPVRVANWMPGQPISVVVDRDVIVVRGAASSSICVTRQGHLRIPASVRHRCRLSAGERLLVGASREHGVVIAWPGSVMDAMVGAYLMASSAVRIDG